MKTCLGVVASFLVAASAGSARADVIVVDPHGGPGAALLQSALDASHSGDVVLVKPGDYSSPEPLNLPPGNVDIALVGDAPSRVVLPGLVAASLDGRVLVRGLEFAPADHGDADAGLDVAGQGELWIEDCVSVGQDGWQDGPWLSHGPAEGLALLGTPSVIAARSRFVGGRGLDGLYGYSGNGGTGMRVEQSSSPHPTVCLFDTTVKAGASGYGMPYSHNGGASGLLLLYAGPCVVLGGSLVGGDEGGDNPPETMSGPGLDCLLSKVFLRGATVQAGGVVGVGTVGPAINNFSSYITELYAPLRFVAINSPVREFETAGVHASAQPGDAAWLFVSSEPGALWLPAKQGVYAADATSPVLPVFLGDVDATGTLEATVQLPALPAGTDSALFFAQLAVIDAQGEALLGSASSVVWISASF